MDKYSLSEEQLRSVFRKLIDSGIIDEMELFLRTSLSTSTISSAFKGAQCAMEKIGHRKETTSLPDPEIASNVSITEKVTTTSGAFRGMLAQLGRTGS